VKIATVPHARISRGSPVEQVFPARTTIAVSKELTEALTFLVFLAVMAIVVFRHLGALTISSAQTEVLLSAFAVAVLIGPSWCPSGSGRASPQQILRGQPISANAENQKCGA
jgi:hypothetical protein